MRAGRRCHTGQFISSVAGDELIATGGRGLSAESGCVLNKTLYSVCNKRSRDANKNGRAAKRYKDCRVNPFICDHLV